MANEPDWKIAQNKVADAMKLFTADKKDFYGKSFTDTYAARGNITQAQPSDFWFVYQSRYTIMEVKSSHYVDKFYFKDVQPGQWAGARRITAAGCQSIFVLVKLPEWQWYFMDGREMVRRKMLDEKGIRWDEMTPIKLKLQEILDKTASVYNTRVEDLTKLL